MQAMDPREALAEGARLVAVKRVVAVREARIVGETQVGRPPVRSVLRGAGDAQLRRHIGAAGEIGRRELAAAAEGIAQVVDDPSGDGPRPRQVGVYPAARAGVDELEQVGRNAARALISHAAVDGDRKSTRLNSSHANISY